jgi:hypothetical protein
MAITDYNSLATAIKTWTARTNSVSFNNQIDTFVALAEVRIYNGSGSDEKDPLFCDALNAPEMEANDTLTTDANSQVTLPSYVSTLRTLKRTGDMVGLDYMSPLQFNTMAAQPGAAGTPGYYTIEGNVLKVTPSYTGDLVALHYRKYDPLSVLAPTNAILASYPLVYLQGCLFEAFSFLQEPELAMGHFARYKSLVHGINNSATSVRFGGAPLRIRTRQAMP